MAFQFKCPQGHLLEGDESQAGQQCQCPDCGMTFVIPSPVPEAAGESEARDGSAAETEMLPDVTGKVLLSGDDPFAEPEDQVFHIPCPNGHELETPREMFGQEVLCPHCGAQFQLREKNSVEYKKIRAAELEARDRVRGKLWLNWAIAIAVVVGLALIGMFFIIGSASR